MQTFELNHLVEYTDENIIKEMQRVASLIGDATLTKDLFDKHSKVSASTVYKRFSGWRNALQKAGLDFKYAGTVVSEKMKLQQARQMSDEEVLAELRCVAKRIGRAELTVEEFNSHSKISAYSVRNRFGSWKQSLQLAGLSETNLGRRYSDDECFENLLKVWTHHGRQPKYQEINQPPSTVGAKAYIRRWGTWRRTLQAFVTKVNEGEDVAQFKPEEVLKVELPQVKKVSTLEEDQRNIRLGLRYKILVRDKFKCVLCGDSPAKNPSCILHIDHIYPWAKGGKTVVENLRTLCEQCNLGKSDLTIEFDGAG